jgi:hypothetical protein
MLASRTTLSCESGLLRHIKKTLDKLELYIYIYIYTNNLSSFKISAASQPSEL